MPPRIKWTNPITPTQVHTLIRSEPDIHKALLIFNSATSSPNYTHSLPTHSLILSRLSAANLFDPAESILSQLPIPPSESLFLPLLRAYGRSHKPLHSLHLFRRMQSHFQITPTHSSYNALLAVLVSANQSNLAHQLFSQMKQAGIPPTLATLNVLIKSLSSNPTTLNSAVKIYNQMETTRNCVPDACTYGTLIDGLCKHGRVDDARKLFVEMIDKGVQPTVVTFTSFINGLCKDGRLDEAFEMFEEMGRRGIKPNVVTYSCLLDGLAKGGMSMKALGLLDRMVADKCPPNMISYSALINGLCSERRIREASEVLDRMRLQGRKPDAGLYGKIIKGFCEVRKFRDAVNYLDEMVLSGVLPNRVTWSLHIRMNNMVLRGLCGDGLLSRGFQVYQSMRTRGISVEPESFHFLVEAYCKRGDVHKAARIVDEMLLEGCAPERETWSVVLDGYWSQRKVKEAAQVLWSKLESEELGC